MFYKGARQLNVCFILSFIFKFYFLLKFITNIDETNQKRSPNNRKSEYKGKSSPCSVLINAKEPPEKREFGTYGICAHVTNAHADVSCEAIGQIINWAFNYTHTLYMRVENALVSMCKYAGLSEPPLLVDERRAKSRVLAHLLFCIGSTYPKFVSSKVYFGLIGKFAVM